MEIIKMTEEIDDLEEAARFFKQWEEAVHNLNLDKRTFSAEDVYQDLCARQTDLNEDEALVFKIFSYDREVHERVESEVFSTKINLPFPHSERFNIGPMYFDWDGSPIRQWEWSVKNGYFSKHVAEDVIHGWRISTVWLGLNHSFWKDNDPIIFETMIFKEDESIPDNEFCNHYQERYCTLESAEVGHEKACYEVELLIAKEKNGM